MELARALRLYLIADASVTSPERLPAVVAAALDGGVTMVQLRAKSLTTRAQVDLARALRQHCRAAGAPFIVNDRADVAVASGADGVHVGHIGEEDLLPDEVRRVAGPGTIVGVSVGSGDEARRVQGASYLSAGPMYPTTTKADAGPAVGPELARTVKRVTRLPLVVIGGIRAEHVAALVEAGADGVCVASAILCAADPRGAARSFADALAQVRVPA